jgi:aryl-alcohol dehydrogenase-like predicted oxidoreductase
MIGTLKRTHHHPAAKTTRFSLSGGVSRHSQESAMPLNHYVTLGRSGLAVSPFCLGAMTFGEDLGWGASEAESRKMIDRYLEGGGNFIDTANLYTRGHSEKILGDHLGRDRARRQRVVLATKFFCNLYPGDPNSGGASRKAILSQCEHSLRRLQTDYIDLYWMHAWDRHTPIDETMRALDDLVRQGKVRYIGFSDTPAWKAAEAQVMARHCGWSPVIALQVEYSLLERTVEGELIPMAREMGLGVTPWSPLRYGILTGKYTRESARKGEAARGAWVTSSLTDKAFEVVEVVKKVAGEIGSTPARVALAWVLSRPGVTSPILGARSLDHLEDNLKALEVRLAPEQLQALEEVSRPALNFPADFLLRAGGFARGGSTLDGARYEPLPFAPTPEKPAY